MTKITLIRHAIAQDHSEQESDFLRILTPDGRKKCLKYLQKHSDQLQDIDLILCSPASRTRQTCNLVCSVIHKENQAIEYNEDIYTFENDHTKLLQILQNATHNHNHICLIGHNNSISALASYLRKETLHMKKGKIVFTTLSK